MKTFSQYIEHRDVNEAFFDKMKQGFQASYQSAKGDEKENASQTDKQYEKAKEIAHKAINVGKSMSDKLNKLGLSLPFAATLIAAGMTGGAAAIPIALLSKVISDEIIHYAAKGFDKVTDMTVGKAPAMAESSFVDRTGKMISGAVDRTGKMISGAMDKAGETIGGGAGFIAGKTSKYYSKLRTMAEKSIGDIMLFLGHNKRYLAKALFLFAVGHVIGSGIGNATNFYAKDSLDSVASSLAGVGGVDQSELLSIMKNVGNEVSKGVDIGLHAAPHLPSNLPNLSALKNVSQEI